MVYRLFLCPIDCGGRYHAAAGAGGVLIIVTMLEDTQVRALLDAAREMGQFALLEGFDADDLDRIATFDMPADSPPVLAGLNCRNLVTLDVDFERFDALAPKLPAGFPAVAESGVASADDIRRVAKLGYRLALVGSTTLQLARDVSVAAEAATRALTKLEQSFTGPLRARVEAYRASLGVLRNLVPDQSEVANLIDDINVRAKVRGLDVASFTPQAPVAGPDPFDTHTYSFSVIGRYNQVGAFLTDVASLRRIIVPSNVTISRAEANTARLFGDTLSTLEARFNVRTYVKAPAGDTVNAY